jgi:hypothetical protein
MLQSGAHHPSIPRSPTEPGHTVVRSGPLQMWAGLPPPPHRTPMTTTTTTRATDAHPIELALVALLALGLAVRELAVGLIALVGTVASYGRPWRSAPAAPAALPALPAAPAAPVAPVAPALHPIGEALALLAVLPVRELRTMARDAGHRRLARSGRRADLLAALGAI